MSVSQKIWFLFFSILAVIILLFLSYFILKSWQTSLYSAANLQNMNKILDAAIDSYENQYYSFIKDYTCWDELVRFTRTKDKFWAYENMESALSNYGLDYLCIFNMDRKTVYIPPNHVILPCITAEIFETLVRKRSTHFFISDRGTVIEVFSATINRSIDITKTGPIYGYFMVGLVWTRHKLDQFEKITGYTIRLTDQPDGDVPVKHSMQVIRKLEDISGNTIAYLQITSENLYIREANKLSVIELISFISLSLILLVLVSSTIHRYIALPLKKLARALQFNDSTILQTIRSNDEFSDIAKMVLNSFQQEEMLINETIRLKELETSLSESENKFRSYFNNSPEAIIIMNEKGKIMQANQATTDSTGYTRDEILQMSFTDFLQPDDLNRGLETFRKMAMEGHHQNEFRVVKKDGGVLFMTINSYKSKDNEFISFCQDISALKMKEIALKESEEKFMILFYSTPIPIMILDREDRKIIDVNESFEEVFGYTKKEVVGYTSLEKGFADAEDFGIFYEALKERNEIKNVRYRFMKKNGIKGYGLISGVTLTAGRRKMLLAAITDITELKAAEDQLFQLNQNLEDRVRQELDKNREKDLLMLKQSRLAAMGETIHNIAHQWRQPLNALGILIQNLKLHIQEPNFSTACLSNFEKKSMDLVLHLSRTIDDFRNFFKIDRDKIEFRLRDVITQTVSIIEATYKNNFIRLDLNIGRDTVLQGYPNEYAQVLLNILNNSKEAFVERKIADPRVMIELDYDPNKAKSVVRISDNAGGIPEDIMGKIFDPYFTTKDAGSGIGLYMSKYIIEKRMNGKILVQNIPGGLEVAIIV